jgi:uncharacterized protein YwgA
MKFEEYEWVAAVVNAHPGQKVAGRTRIQKTVKLLQRLGMPTAYRYRIHHFGPYSEAVQSDISLLSRIGLVTEDGVSTQDGNICYLIRVDRRVALPDVSRYQKAIDRMATSDSVVLELAATYDAFREMGLTHEDAMLKLREKKGSKCDGGREGQALNLLAELGLSAE